METLEGCLRCPHCLEELSYLEDPKQLPCSHIFCMPCLESITTIIDTGVDIACSLCSVPHQLFNLSWLPQGQQPVQTDDDAEDNISTDGPETSAQKCCDKCKAEDKVAVSFCVDCNKKLCDHHEQAHQDFFDDEDIKHQILSIQVYSSKPNFYKRDRCATHKKEFYAMCCEKCYTLACCKCNNSHCQIKELESDKRHAYLTLEQTAIKLKSEFEALIKKCSDKITEMCKIEKETWLKLDNLEEECQDLIEQVETKANTLIETIKLELDGVRGIIRAHEKEGKGKVEQHLLELREERERLEEMKAENSQFLQQNNVVEIINNRTERMKLLEDDTLAYGSNFSLPDMKLVKRTLAKFMEFDISIVPRHLQLLSPHDTGSRCYAASFCKDGRLMIGCNTGIMMYSSFINYEETLNLGTVTSIASSGEGTEFFFVEHHVDERVVGKSSPDLSEWQEVFKYEYPGIKASRLAVSPEFLVGTAEKSIVVHKRSAKTTTSQKLSYAPRLLRFDSDNNLLITTSSNELIKYRLDGEGKLTLMWTCADLEGAGGIALTRYGDTVVKSGTQKQIYIISPQGKLLQTITHEALTKEISSIDIHGDILIEPCWGENEFNRFLLS